MPSDTIAESAPSDAAPKRVSKSDEYIQRQIRRTRGQVKRVDLFSRLFALFCGLLTSLFLVVLADHWLVSGGLGSGVRAMALVVMVFGAVMYLVLRVLPIVWRSVNPVYAALTIEQTEPETRNSLINYLLLRSDSRGTRRTIVRAMRRKAADDLTKVDVEHVVDRGPLLWMTYWLLALVVILSAYKLFSPKDPLRSMGRVIMPWQEIAPPTRVTIGEVQPGDASAFHGDVLEVSAHVRGLEPDETVQLVYSTDDGQALKRPIPMRLPDEGYRHRAPLPADDRGLTQDLEYTIVAGDARSGPFRVTVSAAPSMLVERVEYNPPKYTGLGSRTLSDRGDVQAVEGTRVVIHARANCPIERAWIDLGCDGRRDRAMEVSGEEATGEFLLSLGQDGRAVADCYQIRFTNRDGHENPRPVRYRIAVVPDEAPIVEIREPTSFESEVPQDGKLQIVAVARDADFSLSELELVFAGQQGKTLKRESLLSEPTSTEATVEFEFAPERLRLVTGDVVTFWVEAADNRQPKPNRSQSDHYRITITSPENDPAENQLARNDPRKAEPDADADEPAARRPARPGEQGEPGAEPTPMEDENTDPPLDPNQAQEADGAGEGAQAGDEQAGDEQGQDPEAAAGERIDPESNPGDAFEKILEHLEEQDQGEQPQDGQDQQPPDNGNEENAAQPSDANQDDAEQGEGGAGESGDDMAASDAANDDQSGNDVGDQGADSPKDEKQQSGSSGNDSPGGEGSGDSESMDEGDASDQQSSGSKPGSDDNAGDDSTSDDDNSGGEMNQSDSGGDASGRQSGKIDEGRASEDASDDLPSDSDSTMQSRTGDGDKALDAAQQSDQSPQPEQRDASETSGGEPQSPKGDSGAGQPKGNDEGAPQPLKPQQTRDKQQSEPQSAESESSGEETTEPAISETESDSRGGESGDRSGGGQEGGGQKANAQGTGGAGQNTASDEGASAAEGSGDGETSSQGGDKTDGAAPMQGEGEKVDGQGQSSDSSGQSGGSHSSDSTSGDSGSSNSANDSDGGPSSTGGGTSTSTQPTTGGGTSGGPQHGSQPGSSDADDGSEPGGDEANLDYAKKATDLAISNLKDQLANDQLDEELLRELGWTRGDVERFVAQWDRLRQQADEGNDPDAQDRFEEALGSLGLRPRSTQIEGHQGTQQMDLRASQRVAPPREYREQFEAYTESAARGRPSRRRATSAPSGN